MSIDNTLKQWNTHPHCQMKPGMAGQGLMKVLAVNLSVDIAFFLSSHTESVSDHHLMLRVGD